MATFINFIAVFLCLSAPALAQKGMVHVDDDFMVNYEPVGNSSIKFEIIATTKGWVTIGLNSEAGKMHGSDFFMGGVTDETNATYGNDYFLPTNATEKRPHLDSVLNNGTRQSDWTNISGMQTVDSKTNKTTTTIRVQRLLNTTDMDHDVVIQNATINFLWAYNTETDDVTVGHSKNGFKTVNLVYSAPSTAPTHTLGFGSLLFGLLLASPVWIVCKIEKLSVRLT